MKMSFQNLMLYNEILQQKGLLDDIYKAVSTSDESAVLEAYKVMNVTEGFPVELKHVKSHDQSCNFRSQGNNYYLERNYLAALGMYNRALLYAAQGSLDMLHAYGNRSALLYHIKAYSACVKDIEICRQLKCTGQLAKKLNERYDLCQQNLRCQQNAYDDVHLSDFGRKFFTFNVKKHPDVPSLSAYVDIVSESGGRKAVAATDIKLGTVVALETPFATYSHKDKFFFSCYHCQIMALNLYPCEHCCHALYCSDECKEASLKEYHNIECQISGILETIDAGFQFRLTIKSVLKFKNMCKDWSTFIKEANNIGAKRLNKSPLNEVYDVENSASILCFKEDRRFVFGTLYNSCFIYASILQHLEKIKDFFPESKSVDLEARKSFGNLCVNLHVNWITTEFLTPVSIISPGEAGVFLSLRERLLAYSYGWFPFTGKLKHSCEPNLLLMGLDNKVALVAIRPINKMAELTLSYVGHWYEHLYEDTRRMKIYQSILNVCHCRVCEGAWGVRGLPQPDLDPKQKQLYHSWENKLKSVNRPAPNPSVFLATCETLAALDDLPNTAPHYRLFEQLKMMLSQCQYAYGNTGCNTINRCVFDTDVLVRIEKVYDQYNYFLK